MTVWADVKPEHDRNVGFVEGPGNKNPWTEEMGAGDAAYCCAAATIVPHHHGVNWWPDSQFGAKGVAYSPWLEQVAARHGCWAAGPNVDLITSDIVTLDWNHDGVADHTETVIAVYADGTFDTVGYNTGHPEGCHAPIRRDRKYLHGRVRMTGNLYVAAPAPTPPGGTVVPAGYPFRVTSAQLVDWVIIGSSGWVLDSNGAIYAGPGTQAMEGVNGQSYFAGRQAAKLHVRVENGIFVNTIEDSIGELYRRDGGPPFRTH